MIVQRPSEEEFNEVVEKYGLPRLTQREIHFNFDFEDDLECKGEAVLEIKNDKGLKAGVRHSGATKFVLPQGRIEESETIEAAIKREALEETGLEIEIRELKEVRDVDIEFSNEILNRWYFLFLCDVSGGNLEPEDKDEIVEADFFEEVPWKMEFY